METGFIILNQFYTWKQAKKLLNKTNKIHQHDWIENALTFIASWCNKQNQYNLQTSGSTGKPKHITIFRKQMEYSAVNTIQYLNLKNNENNYLLCLNAKYIGAKMMIVRAIMTNAILHIIKPSLIWYKYIEKHQNKKNINLITLVPNQLKNVIYNKKNTNIWNQIENIIVGGAPINFKIPNYCTNKTNVFASYGMTETASHIALSKITSEPNTNINYTPLGDVKLTIGNKNNLIINGTITNNTKIETNDIAIINDNNTFQILGRTDNIINSGGIKICPQILEHIYESKFNYLKINHLFDFVIVFKNDKNWGQIPILVYEIIKEKNLNANLIKEKIWTVVNNTTQVPQNFETPLELSHYNKVLPIKNILEIKKLPRTQNGKIKRNNLNQQINQ